jgi:hypothetical protein
MTNESRAAFEAWAIGILGDNPTWRESGDCELAWTAWQASREVALNEAADAIIKMNLNELQQDQYLLNYTAQLMTSTAEQIRRFV